MRAFWVAFSYLSAGDVEKALPWFERSLADRDWIVRYGWVTTERLPGMSAMLADPRMVAFRKRAESATLPTP